MLPLILFLPLFFVGRLLISHAAHLIFMSISVCHLREALTAEFALVGCLPSVHVNVILNVVELGVRLAAVLALKQLVRPSRAEVGLEPLDVTAVVAVGVDTLFSVNFCRVNIGLFVSNILFKVKVRLVSHFNWCGSVQRLTISSVMRHLRVVNYRVRLGGRLAYERHQDGLVSA